MCASSPLQDLMVSAWRLYYGGELVSIIDCLYLGSLHILYDTTSALEKWGLSLT